MNNDTKTIHVTLPEIIITEVDVDEKSLDYMFVKDSLNEAGISGEAYNLCIADVKEESERESTLYELAKENAVKTVKALLVPLIEQMDSEYAVEVQ